MTNVIVALENIINHTHKTNEVWTISLAFNYAKSNGYLKTKRTFERELKDIKFHPSREFDETNQKLKKLVYNHWHELINRKRYLSLKSSTYNFNGNNFIFYEDGRGAIYWHSLGPIDNSNFIDAAKKILKFLKQTCIIWPSIDLLNAYFFAVKENGSETVAINKNNKVIYPVSSFQEDLTAESFSFKTRLSENISKNKKDLITHLEKIESESIHIIRETVAESENPVMLYSVGKDSAVMLHLAKKAFYPAPPPFPLMHVDTCWKFNQMYQFRDLMAKEAGMDLIVYKNEDGIKQGINPLSHGSEIHTDIMKTQALKKALDKYNFDYAFGGARRDEEKSRAKERILSFRSELHAWDPKNQRPELWDLYNFNKHKNQSARVFPISNWTELDVWQYIYKETIPIVPLYYAAERPFVERDGVLIMVDDDRFKLYNEEKIKITKARFRTLGCYPLTGAVESEADEISSILLELINSKTTEREGRLIDSDSDASMEKKKKEGYF